jgi:hypothetical protein
MTEPAYPIARKIAATVHEQLQESLAEANMRGEQVSASVPDARTIEDLIEAAFWASLRREENTSPKISLALLPPEQAGQPLAFGRRLPLTPTALARLAPAVERPGIHLGVWHDGDELRVWGITRTVPRFCFVLEVIEPGLLVIKYRKGEDLSKFVNIVVLKGDQIKVVDEEGTSLPDCPPLIKTLLGFGSSPDGVDSVNLLVQLAVSMRAHGRGGALLVVPKGSHMWWESIVQPVPYLVIPPYSRLADLMRQSEEKRRERQWRDSVRNAVDVIGGLTAVDGAAVINDQFELLAFSAKIGRREGGAPVENVVVTEPVIDNTPSVMHPVQLGGTRHLSAAQFVQDQRDSTALVASQDGRFTVFAWSPCEEMVHAHRVETLLL